MNPSDLNDPITVSWTEFCDALKDIADVTVIHRGRKPDIRIENGAFTNLELWSLVDDSRFTIRNIDWNNKVIQFRPGRHPDEPARYLWYDHANQAILTFPDGPLFTGLGAALSAYADHYSDPSPTHSLSQIHVSEQRPAISFAELTD